MIKVHQWLHLYHIICPWVPLPVACLDILELLFLPSFYLHTLLNRYDERHSSCLPSYIKLSALITGKSVQSKIIRYNTLRKVFRYASLVSSNGKVDPFIQTTATWNRKRKKSTFYRSHLDSSLDKDLQNPLLLQLLHHLCCKICSSGLPLGSATFLLPYPHLITWYNTT